MDLSRRQHQHEIAEPALNTKVKPHHHLTCGLPIRAFLLSAIALFMVFEPAKAFLGDNMLVIEREYGPTTYQGTKSWIFHSQQYRISVTFTDGKSTTEAFSNFDKTPLTREEIQSVLQAQGKGNLWKQAAPSSDGSLNWVRDGAIANYDPTEPFPMLMIISRPGKVVSKIAPPATASPTAIALLPPGVATPAPTALDKTPSMADGSWDDGYKQGYPIGNEAAARHMPMPSTQELLNTAAVVMKMKVHPPNEAEWLRGFAVGFRTGYAKAGY